jgi:tripartite-type tricarboxylate transporter receptor subunit TctC
MPDVPTLDEQGIASLKGFETFGWMGAFLPAGTPAPIAARLHKELAEVVKSEDFRKAMNASAFDVPAPPLTPAEFNQFIKKDYGRWSKIASDLRIALD